MSEKITDFKMLEIFKNITGKEYNTENNKQLFDTLVPDGWFILDDESIFIIENKKDVSLLDKAKSQIIKYCNKVENKFKNIYCCIGYNTYDDFDLNLYKYDNGNINIINESINKFLKRFIKTKNEKEDINPHIINEYLYKNNINIPKTQKTLLISLILIILKNNIHYYSIHENDNDDEFIINILSFIESKYNDNIFNNQFSFLKQTLYKRYIKKIFKKISSYVDNNSSEDIINKFYSEFQFYDKNNEKNLGIVLTPSDIVKLMITELNIKESDVVLDTCTGTGSFLIEAGKYTKKIIGCENNEERYALAKCNFIINDMNTKYLYYDSCFNIEFKKCDKLIINPPFSCNCDDEEVELNLTNWKNFKEEQKFVLYAIQYIKDGGKGCVIIPRNNFNNSTKKYNNFKKELLNHITPIKIINCNKEIFAPVASVECSILIFIKQSCTKENINITQIDYKDDGYKINKNIRTKIKEPLPKNKEIIINYDDDWNYIEDKSNYDKKDLLNEILLYNTNYIYSKWNLDIKRNNIIKQYDPYNYPLKYNIINNYKNFITITIKDIFDIVKISKDMKIDINKSNEGNIPLISNTTNNNSIVKYIDKATFTKGKYLTVGSLGVVAYNKVPFSVTDRIYVLKSKKENIYSLHLISILLNNIYKSIYCFNNRINKDKILNTIINIPIE